jgi:SNF2 family DNA or RNA helicase
MGLGKTVEALAHMLVEKREGRLDRPCLVVCPTSVVPNWCAEAARLAPELRVLSLHGADRATRFGEIANSDLVVTTYALLPRDADRLLAVEWHLAVLDEAQAIKNVATKATQIACRIQARHRLCLTGTPVENHLGELWSQFAFLMPGLLGDAKRFARVFRTPIEKRQDGERRAVLAARLKPFLLRRTKAVVAADLPPKSEIVSPLELSGPQRDLYETVRLAMHEKVRQEVAAKGFARSRIVILDALLKLRQVCCDPRLVKLAAARKVSASAKLAHLMDMVPALVEDGRRILLFSQFTSMLDLIKPELVRAGIAFAELRGNTIDRAGPVARFQNGKVPLFLISLRAGGTGLNLTAADTVIHYDPWWNPAVEDQATDRAHRIGQDKSVFVYKLVAQGTVEERMIELQQRKRALASGIYDERDAAGPLLEAADLDRLFEPLAG